MAKKKKFPFASAVEEPVVETPAPVKAEAPKQTPKPAPAPKPKKVVEDDSWED